MQKCLCDYLNKKIDGGLSMNMDFLDELIEKADEVMGKKLTTKDRKKLSKSTFCGPGRSFPVE